MVQKLNSTIVPCEFLASGSVAFITCIEVLDKAPFSYFPYKLSYLSQFSKNVVETFRHMAETKLSGWQVVFLCEHRLYIHPVFTSVFIYPACVQTHYIKNITDRLLAAFGKKYLHENFNYVSSGVKVTVFKRCIWLI